MCGLSHRLMDSNFLGLNDPVKGNAQWNLTHMVIIFAPTIRTTYLPVSASTSSISPFPLLQHAAYGIGIA